MGLVGFLPVLSCWLSVLVNASLSYNTIFLSSLGLWQPSKSISASSCDKSLTER